MKLLALIGIFFVAYYGCQLVLAWARIKKQNLERQAMQDIEMQKVITEVKTKVIKFEPRRNK